MRSTRRAPGTACCASTASRSPTGRPTRSSPARRSSGPTGTSSRSPATAGRSGSCRPTTTAAEHGVLDVLLDPWRDETTRRALVEVLLLGAAAGPLGCWIVFYRLSYGAESLAHGLLPGLVAAALLGLPLLLGGAAGLAVAAVSIALAGCTPAIGGDNAVAVVVTGLFGLGALLALSPQTPAGLGELLFGDVLGLGDGDLLLAAGLAVLVLGALWVVHHGLLTVGFDRTSAAALGRAPLVADLVLGLLLAAVLLVAVQGLGNLLV